MIFFTSDTHFGHANIIKYCNRPFSSVEEMNEAMVKNWNRKVSPNDTVYHLGDFAFLPPDKANWYLSRLNGNKFLVPGNHDSETKIKEYAHINSLNGFTILPSLYEFKAKVEDEKIHFVLCHYAMRVWNKSHHGAIHLYGHSHGSLPEDPNSLSCDVGVDCWNFEPVSLDEILVKMYKKKFVPVDHHGETGRY